MAGTGVVILAHGSRGEQEPYVRLGEIVRRLQGRLGPQTPVGGAALQFNHPNLAECIQDMTSKGVSRIAVLPYFLFDGTHVNVDIPNELEELRHKYPSVEITLARTLGIDDRLIDLLMDRLAEASTGITPPPEAEYPRLGPYEIEADSMALIEHILPADTWTGAERDVVIRLIHASGDPGIARLVKIHPGAVAAGLDAIENKCLIVTDVRMVAAGISANAAGRGCRVNCLVDNADVARLARESGRTRAETAIGIFGTELDGAIVAIGNAPTALFALLDLVEKGQVRPALIAGMPVGFVGAAESKAALAKLNIPYITVMGTRGGSPLAAAAVNALLKQSRKGEL